MGRSTPTVPKWGRGRSGLGILALCALVPSLMGGCPEFRNQSVDAVETATRGIVDAAVVLFFEQFRNTNTSTGR